MPQHRSRLKTPDSTCEGHPLPAGLNPRCFGSVLPISRPRGNFACDSILAFLPDNRHTVTAWYLHRFWYLHLDRRDLHNPTCEFNLKASTIDLEMAAIMEAACVTII